MKNNFNPNMTIGNFNHKPNRSLVPAGLGNSQYQPLNKLDGQINNFAVGQSQLQDVDYMQGRNPHRHLQTQNNQPIMNNIQKSMNSTMRSN